MPDPPSELRLEVKSSRVGSYVLSERDLDGPGPGGFVVGLINDRLLRGPRWVLVPVRVLQARSYSETEFNVAATLADLAERLNEEWSTWILDRVAWERLFEPGATGIAERIRWCRRENPPRRNQSRGNVRETRLDAAFQEFRARLDQAATGESGSQVEGQVHQALLKDGLEQLGYVVLQNPVGVPDIVATREKNVEAEEIRSRLASWEPSALRLKEVRRALLELEPAELRQLIETLRRS